MGGRVIEQFQIRLCPALQNKPRLPTPDFSEDAPAAKEQEKKRHDPFAPPYVPNLYLGEVRDEAEGNEYVILVSPLTFLVYLRWICW